MRILLLTQWFQPEPQFKGLPLAQALTKLGHEVEVLTGFPNYPGGKLYPGYRLKLWQRDTIKGIKVTRAFLYPSHDKSAFRRILNYSSFALSSALMVFSIRRPDVVYVYCPPMTAAAAAVALRFIRRVPYVIDIQDLWPDTLASTGMVNNQVIMSLVGAWSKFAMQFAAALVVLSPGFKQRLEERQVRPRIYVIPNWAPPEIEEQARAVVGKNSGKDRSFNILFAGNMGKAQALETVIEAAQRLKTEAPWVRFTFIGGGVEVDNLRAACKSKEIDNVTFLKARAPQDMGPVFAEADALLVHLRDDPLFAITIPSKTQAYLAIGRPILMGVRGDAAKLVELAGAGINFTPEDPTSLAAAVVTLSGLSVEARNAMGAAGSAFYNDNLSFDKGVKNLEGVLVSAAFDSPNQAG